MVLDTLTTREAVRRAALDDLVSRCEMAAQTMEGGELDGIKVVSMGTLRDQVSAALMVRLPPPPDNFAEVSTPATVTVSAFCPECGLAVKIVAILTPELVVDASGAEIKIKAKAKKSPHQHNQLSIDDAAAAAGDQVGLDELIASDTYKLRVLRAVATVGDRYADQPEGGQLPPPSLDAIAQELELATEDERFELLDRLLEYRSEGLVADSDGPDDTGPTTYALTDAGSELIDAADEVDVDQVVDDDGGTDMEAGDGEDPTP